MGRRRIAVLLCICLAWFAPRNIYSDSITKADKYFAKFDYLDAIRIYEKVLAKKPSMDVALKLAHCYRLIGDSRKAEQAYARVLTYTAFKPDTYKYYADALKQNGKYDEAKANYLMYAEKDYSRAIDAVRLANSCDVARMWAANPNPGAGVESKTQYNSSGSEHSMTAYGSNMAFVSDRWFAKGKDGVSTFTGNPYSKLFLSRNGGTPELLPAPLNGDFEIAGAVFTAAGDEIYISRTDGPNDPRKHLYYSRKNGNSWLEPKRVFPDIEHTVQHPSLTEDAKTLYFASDMPGGHGGMDIYYSVRQADGSWTKPQNCGKAINTIENEAAPVIKGQVLYFASGGHIGMGGLDIFRSKVSGGNFSEPENLKAPINSSKDDYGILFLTGESGYFASNRDGGQGGSDIYQFTLREVPQASPQPVFAIAGEVAEKQSGRALSGMDIMLLNKDTGKETRTTSDASGKFSFNLEPGHDYLVKGNSQQYYLAQEGEISTKGVDVSTVFNVRFELERSEEAYMVRMKNIYYDFDRWNIRPDARPELERVLNFMNTLPDVAVEMRAHTDSRGTAAYNLQLSQKRAQSAAGFLTAGGISPLRVSARGFGEQELLNSCAEGKKCSEEQHQLNRRTEFKVVRMKTVDLASAVKGVNKHR